VVPPVSMMCVVLGAALAGASVRAAMPPAIWIALVLLLHASRSMTAAGGALLLWVALYAAVLAGNRGIIPAPRAEYVLIVLLEAAVITLPFAVDRAVTPKFHGVAATLVFPATYAAVEFLRTRFLPSASWGSIAYSQYGYLPMMQVAAVAGLSGITFLIAWTASTAEYAWAHRFDTAVAVPIVACGAVLGMAIFGGTMRLLFAPTDRPSLRAATLNRPVDLFAPGEITQITEGRVSPPERAAFAPKLARLHDWFLDGSRREARAGARLILWPEQNLLVFADEERAFIDRAARLAAEERVYLAMGLGTIHLAEKLPFENKLVVIDPGGRVVATYLKSRPVPGWEASIMRRGDGKMQVVPTEYGRLATAICFEADHPAFIRQAGQSRADVLLLPANDWETIKHRHAQMAAFRAIENGMTIVRAAASGVSNVYDPWGRSLAAVDFFAPGDRTMTAQVPLGAVRTLYARTGDVFGWLCIAAAALLAAIRAIR